MPSNTPLPLVAPETSGFLLVGVNSSSPPKLPLVRWNRRRRQLAAQVVAAAGSLESREDVAYVRVFRSRILPPLHGMPRHDLTLLIRTSSPADVAAVRESDTLTGFDTTTLLAGSNAAKIGETESSGKGDFLLNHFTTDGDLDPIDAWLGLTDWYTTAIGVDNSTALRGDSASQFPLVNYVRLPSSPPAFLVNQLLRPSLHRVVRGTLKRSRMRALPGFYRMIR